MAGHGVGLQPVHGPNGEAAGSDGAAAGGQTPLTGFVRRAETGSQRLEEGGQFVGTTSTGTGTSTADVRRTRFT